jgi:hypothetical protein
VSGITNLGSCNDPIEALSIICKTELGVLDAFKDTYANLTTFYVFCAGPEVKKNEEGGSHHSKDHWPKYGTEFAQFLIDNKLGEVSTVGPKRNKKHHRNSTAQVWLWSPNQEAVEAWWTEQQKGKGDGVE